MRLWRNLMAVSVVFSAVALAFADERAPEVAPRHAGDRFLDELDCSACHTASGWALSGEGSTGRGFDHARTGFPLSGRHRQTACVACHAPNRPAERACSGCHRDAHAGRLGDTCEGCHSAVSWSATAALERHQRTRFPLDGMHSVIACNDCHRRSAERTWSSVPNRCFACHEADYRRDDVHPDHQGTASSAPFPRDCSQCHRTAAWVPAFFDPDVVRRTSGLQATPEHDLRFPISSGVHRGLACESCHLTREPGAAIGCTGCHAHGAAQLRRDHVGRRIASDGRACLHCHPTGMPR